MVTFLLVVALLELAAVVAAMVDASRRPAGAWRRAGQSKTLWIALEPVGLVLLAVGYVAPLGLVVPVLYFVWIRPSVAAAGDSLAE